MRHSRWLLAVAVAPLFIGLANDIQEFDPSQYAEAGRHMAEGGSWLRPQDNFGPYDDKPPMVFWLIALSIKAFGSTSFAVRLPSLLAALLAIWATVLIGRELWDRETGVLAGALAAASPAMHLMVADPKIDAVVTAFMAWAVYFFLRARRQPWTALAGWCSAASGFLTKGPIALAVPLLAVGPEWIRDRQWRIRPLLGLAIVAAAFAPYAIAAGPQLVYFHLWEQSFGRLTGQSTWRNTAGPLYFAHTALWAFLPFVPALLLDLGTRLRAAVRERALPPDPARVALWWLLLPLIGISASRYKLPQYLYWLAPPGALLAARALHAAPKAAERVLLVAGGALAAAAIALPVAVHRFVYPAPLAWAALPIALVIALRARSFAPLGIAAMAAAMVFFHGAVHPWALSFQPDRALGERARAEEPRASMLPFAGVMPTNAAGFYARRDARGFDAAGLAALVARDGARVVVADPDLLPGLRSRGLRADVLLDLPSVTTSRPTAAFLLAESRPEVVRRILLVRLSAPGSPPGRASTVPTTQ